MRRDLLTCGVLLLAAVHALAVPSAAQEAAGTAHASSPDTDRPTLRAAHLPPGFVLTGALRDPAWAAATDSIAELVTIEPREGAVPKARTVVKVLAGSDGIVVGLRCFDPDPAGIVSPSKARDAVLDEEDHVLLVLDTFRDGRSGYVFAVNPAGARFDGLVTAHGEEANGAWDAIWEARTARDGGGWSAEIRIPARSLGFRKGLASWGFNIQRHVQRLQETSRWSAPARDYEVFQTSRAGYLADLPAFDLGAGLSVRPALVARATKPSRGSDTDYEAELSLDVTKTLGPNLLSSLTVNTDFAETEVDARQINLSRFPLYFPEKRSFFLAGADIFDFGVGLDEESLIPFYSRRIGLFGITEEEQAAIPIDAGGKISGRAGGTNLGALVVGTRRVDRLSLPEEDLVLDVPRATMGAVRVKQNILAESSVGMIATFGDPIGRDRSWTGGLDFTYQTSSLAEDKNLLVGVWGLLDDREDLSGEKSAYGVRVDFPNDPVDINLSSIRIGNGFNPSLGFVPRNNVHLWDLSATLTPRPWWPGVREVTQEVNFRLFNTPNNNTWTSYELSARPLDILFQSGDRVEFVIEPEGDRPEDSFSIADEVDLPAGSYEWTRYSLGAYSADKRWLSGSLRWESGRYYNGDLDVLEGALTVRPSPSLVLEVSGERNTGTLTALLEDETGRETLAERAITEELLGVRLDVNVSPDLQLSSFTQYDTQSRELGSNNRLRWTFAPQGDLFVVYNHNVIRKTGRSWGFVSNQLPLKIQYTWRF